MQYHQVHVDTRGLGGSRCPSCTIRLKAGCQSIHKADDQYRSVYYGWALPPVCLPSVYLTSLHVTRSPRPPPPYLHTVNDQILAVGIGCERGG